MISYFVKITHIFTDYVRGSQTFKQHCIYIFPIVNTSYEMFGLWCRNPVIVQKQMHGGILK